MSTTADGRRGREPGATSARRLTERISCLRRGLPRRQGRPAPLPLRRGRPARAAARSGAARGRALRPDLQQHHLRDVRQGDVLLGLLPGRGGLGSRADVGLRGGERQPPGGAAAGSARCSATCRPPPSCWSMPARVDAHGFVDGSAAPRAAACGLQRLRPRGGRSGLRRRARGRADAAAPAVLHLLADRRLPRRRRGSSARAP